MNYIPTGKFPFKLNHRFFFCFGWERKCEKTKQFQENEQKFIRQHAAIKFSQRA